MEVLLDTTVTVNHGATSAGTAATGETPTNAPYDADATMVDHDAYTHSAGYVPFVLAAVGSNILVPRYPVQTPGSPTAPGAMSRPTAPAARCSCTSIGRGGRPAFQRRVGGLSPDRLPPAAGGRWQRAAAAYRLRPGHWPRDAGRRALAERPALPAGGARRFATGAALWPNARARWRGVPAGEVGRLDLDPVPNTIKQGIYATGGTFASDTLVYGSAMDYGGSWSPAAILPGAGAMTIGGFEIDPEGGSSASPMAAGWRRPPRERWCA